MAYSLTGNSGSATVVTASAIYTAPAGVVGTVVGNISAYNSTGGALTLTLSVLRQDGTAYPLAVASISGTSTASFGRGSTACVCPLTLLPGEAVKAQGSNTGITVTVSGVAFS